MTEGETRFYLREISSNWSTSNVSVNKLAELQAARLIEFRAEPVPTVRLTSEGVRQKSLGRPERVASGIRLCNEARPARRYPPKTRPPRVKPLV